MIFLTNLKNILYLYMSAQQASSFIPDLGSGVFQQSQIQTQGVWTSIQKYLSFERILYIVTGIILLVCIYFYLKNKKDNSNSNNDLDNIYLKEDNSESELNHNLTPIDNQLSPTNDMQDNSLPYETPEGYITIPLDTYNSLQENFVQQQDTPKVIPDQSFMETNLSNEDDLDMTRDLSELNKITNLESSDEEDRTKAQDLTNTEIQSIQNQLNSFKTNNL